MTSTLPSSLQESSATSDPADNMAFNNLLQKEIFSHREPTDKAAKTQSSIEKDKEQDTLPATTANTTPENLLALIVNARTAPLEATQANPDTVTAQLTATVKLTGSDTLNTIVKEPVKNSAISPESSTASYQYRNITSIPVALGSAEPASTTKPMPSNQLNTAIEQSIKDNIIVPESLSTDLQYANTSSAVLSPLKLNPTVNLATSDTLNQVIKEPVKDSLISPESLSANRQHTDITISPALLSSIAPNSTIKPATSDTLNKAIKSM